MKFLDLFSGIGGFRLGMELAGNQCVGWCDIDKYARKSYENMYKDSLNERNEWHGKNIRNVSNIDWEKINKKYGQIQCICGGFPCQSFSIAGRRQGFLDKTRGTLFFEIARAAKEIRPQYLLLENVKGLLSHGKGTTFATILATLDEIGYNVEWNLFNSKDFGVPQNRERVLIIGHLRGKRTSPIFSKSASPKKNSQAIKYFVQASKHKHLHSTDNIYDIDGIAPTLEATDYKNPPHIAYPKSEIPVLKNKHRSARFYSYKGISPTLSATNYKHPIKITCPNKDTTNSNNNHIAVKSNQQKIKYFHHGKHQSKNVVYDNGISPTIDATTYKHKPLIAHKDNVVMPCLTPFRINKRQNGRRFKNNGEPMFTLNTIDRDGVLLAKQLKLNTLPKSAYTLLPKDKIKKQKSGLIFVGFLHGNHRHKGTNKNQIFNSRLYKMPQRIYSSKGVSPTISAQEMQGRYFVLTHVRVRKLTPRECWRLQGFPDYLFDRAKAVNSNTQLYKQAGNSVTVPIIKWIADRMKIYN